MKRFTQSLIGKIVLFAGTVILTCVLAASIILTAFLFSADFYTSSEREVYDSFIRSHLSGDGYRLTAQVIGASEAGSVADFEKTADGKAFLIESGNLIYEIRDQKDTLLATSGKQDQISSWPYVFQYTRILKDGQYNGLFYGNEEDYRNIHFPGEEETEAADPSVEVFTFRAELPGLMTEVDYYSFMAKAVHLAYVLRYWIFVIALFVLAALAVCFIALMTASARVYGQEELKPGLLHRVPSDLMLAVLAVIVMMTASLIIDFQPRPLGSYGAVAAVIAVCIIILNLVLGFCMSIAARLKTRTLFTNTVIFRCLKLLKHFLLWLGRGLKALGSFLADLIRNIPLLWKSVILFGGISVIEFAAILLSNQELDNLLVFWFVEKLVLIPFLLYGVLMLKRLKESGRKLASGALEYRTDTSRMLLDFKEHGEDLNRIGEGMSIAVEDRLKSERMKTELITNVSHDIKTPLTSIINYADLISREPTENEKIKEYTAVLTRQSDRLKRLIEDLVEASKASTGNLEVDPVPCDMGIFVSQAAGEYEEKLAEAQLDLVVSQPEEELMVLADGRRMWRIFDNLMNNICKYAQPGTRVYLSLEKKEDRAVVTFRNISRDPLNMTEEELMERFTRGDASRHTEGSGLGLSIARSLTELQNGTLTISIDGDLFKASAAFPLLEG